MAGVPPLKGSEAPVVWNGFVGIPNEGTIPGTILE